MDNRKLQTIKCLEERIQRLRQTIEILARLPDDLPPEAIITAIPGCLFITIPYDWNIFRAVRRALDASETTWIPSSAISDNDGLHTHCYQMEEDNLRVYLQIQLNPTVEGSKCTRVQIGTQEIPVYKVICEES
jgi:hypothetical protein